MWTVIESRSVGPHMDRIGKYITTMEKQGWKLMFVDQGLLYFRKTDS